MQRYFKILNQYQDIDEDTFKVILNANVPAIIKNCSFGDCTEKWSLEYLNENLADISIVVHESQEKDLDFIGKNFEYKTCTFGKFVDKIHNSDSHVYLRSTNSNSRTKKQARIEDDFPNIGKDLRPPNFIPYGPDNRLYHSSVLRIASTYVQIWTHFDLYDNILCQVRGTKRIILLPPEDTQYLYVEGDKSKVNNFEDWEDCIRKFPLMQQASPHWCILEPGESVYIPACWWHNIRTVSREENDKFSIGFNIFWKNEELEEKAFYADRDIYGNKNLKPFDAAIANLNQAISHIEKLPKKYQIFHKQLLLERMRKNLLSDC